jgi:hypothetical protein
MAGVTFTSNTLTPPIWAGDFLSREHLLPGGAKLLASAFLREDAVVVTLNGSAAQGATSVTVDALSGAIPSGTVLHFNSTEFLITTSAAAAGATALAVEALPVALEDDDTATYTGVGDYAVRSGTLVGRTFAERASGTAFGPWAASDDEVYLVVYDVLNVTTNNDVELYRPNSLVKETFLPDWGDTAVWTTGALAALRATYTTTRGAA